MLVSITNNCKMNCPHCMDCAIPDGDKFMDEKTFVDACKFNFKYDHHMIITGGEPTEHPDFWEYLDIAAKMSGKKDGIIVATNGMNLENDKGELDDKITYYGKNYNVIFQVTSVDGIYPIKINQHKHIFHNKYVRYCTKIEGMYPQGRAMDDPDRWDFYPFVAPKCFNIRSAIKGSKNFGEAIAGLRSAMKFCTPRINFNGDIKVGESSICPSVTSIYDSEEEIVTKICNFTCNQCRHILDKTPAALKAVIGEK